MNKNVSYTAITYFLVRASFIGLSFKIMLTNSYENVWINILIALVIGIIPLFLLHRIAAYKDSLTIRDKCLSLFPKLYFPIIVILLFISLFFGMITFCNLLNFTNINFLNETPIYVIAIAFSIPMLMVISHDNKIIARMALILFYISLFLFIISLIGLIPDTNLDVSRYTLNTKSILSFIGLNITPLFMVLMFPNDRIKKSLGSGYFIAVISLLVTSIVVIGVLGIDLTQLYHYPELHALKSMGYNQWANILGIIWIFDMFILCTVSLSFSNYLLNATNKKKDILPVIVFVISILIINHYKSSAEYLAILSTILSAVLLILFNIKILIKRHQK